jgi:hypothetical protein
MGEFIHHLIPLSHEGFLEKEFDSISCSIISLLFFHGRLHGLAGVFFPKLNQFDT